MSKKGRPKFQHYSTYDFEVVEVDDIEKGKCLNCAGLLTNKSKSRLAIHQKSCKGNGSRNIEDLNQCDDGDDQETPKTSQKQNIVRQKKMDSFADKVDKIEAEVLIDSIATFFFACRIPFNIVEHFFFKKMILKLRPGFKQYMPSRKKLASTLLDRHYKMCIERDCKNMPDRTVLLLDGWKNKTSNEKNVAFMLHNPIEGKSFFIDSYTLRGDEKEDADNLYEMVSSYSGFRF